VNECKADSLIAVVVGIVSAARVRIPTSPLVVVSVRIAIGAAVISPVVAEAWVISIPIKGTASVVATAAIIAAIATPIPAIAAAELTATEPLAAGEPAAPRESLSIF
jgi:hypothetical protein